VTKSVTSLLVGVALDQGRIGSVEQPVLDLLTRYADLRGVDPRRDHLRVQDLLGMRGGLDWREEPYAGSDLDTLNRSSGDWVRFVLDRPMREAPGSSWQYNSGGVIVLAGVLRDTTGMDPAEFARSSLFEPLGIRAANWFRAPFDGLPHTGGGLSLRARDMAKLGELVLRRGRRGERPVVSEAWLDSSTARRSGPFTFWGRPVYYAYLWWLFPRSDGPDVIAASGAGGQWIFVLRDLDLVVAVTSDQNSPDFLRPADILFDEILPSVLSPVRFE
jgi:CubicO group peptidase (beta-lactamase class C family)